MKHVMTQIFLVYKVLLNSQESSTTSGLIESLLSDQYYLDTFGALEYNPDIKITESYRDFLKNQLKFNKLNKISNPEILEKIHLNYRLAYLKDTALATGLDETTIQHITSQINHLSLEILQTVLMSNEIIDELVEKLKSSDLESKTHALSCFSEIF